MQDSKPANAEGKRNFQNILLVHACQSKQRSRFSWFTAGVEINNISKQKNRFFQLIKSVDFFEDVFYFSVVLKQTFNLQGAHPV